LRQIEHRLPAEESPVWLQLWRCITRRGQEHLI